MDYNLIIAESRASQNKVELAKVLKYVGEIQPKVILEIGVHTGYSMVDWQKAFNPELLMGIDNDMHAIDFEATKNMILLDGDSHSQEIYEQVVNHLQNRKIDFLYLDGDHTYEGVKKDYEMYAPLVRSGGIIGFDDIMLDNPQWVMAGVEVKRFWNEVIARVGSKYHTFWDEQGQGTGDGIFYKP